MKEKKPQLHEHLVGLYSVCDNIKCDVFNTYHSIYVLDTTYIPIFMCV